MKRNIGILVALVLLLAISFLMMRYLQSVLPFSLGIDLVPRWVGTQSMLEGISPYSHEARQQVWQVIYGSSEPQGNVFGFYYPPAITTILMPFVMAGISIEIATVAWSTFIWTVWIIAIFLVARKKNLLFFSFLMVSGIFFRPSFSNYILGQNALLSVLALGYAYMLAQEKKWIWASFFLSLSLLKPSFMVFSVIAFLIIYREIKLWLSFFLILILLNTPSFFFIGWWIPDFIREISSYALENQVAWSPSIDILTPTGIIWLGFSGILIFFAIRQKDWILLLVTLLGFNTIFTPHTADYDLVAFLGILLWLKKYTCGWQFLILIWFPWITIFFFSEIENWYQFIWKTYPVLLLTYTIIIAYKNFYLNPSVKNNLYFNL